MNGFTPASLGRGFIVASLSLIAACASPSSGPARDGAGSGAGNSPGAAGAKANGAKTAQEYADEAQAELDDYQKQLRARDARMKAAGDTSAAPAQPGPVANGAAPDNSGAGSNPPAGTGQANAAPPTAVPSADVHATGTAPAPVATTDALAGAAAALYRDASKADSPLRSLMALAALSIAEPDRPFDAEAIPGITDKEKQTLARFHGFCRDLGRQLAKQDDPEAVAKAVERLSREIRGEKGLRVPRCELCSRVDGFGVFKKFEPRDFLAHSGARFVVYFEVEGYQSVEVSGEGWRTDLTVELSILSERDGVPAWRRDWQTITDKAASRRQDFFATDVVTLPESLSVGAYVMKIRVRDEKNGALAEISAPFRVVATLAPPSGSQAAAVAPGQGR